jgi:hypothetical protein
VALQSTGNGEGERSNAVIAGTGPVDLQGADCMTEKRKKEPKVMPFKESLARFIRTDPKELAEKIAKDVLDGQKRVEKRIKETRQEIEDGARPRKGRFRL